MIGEVIIQSVVGGVSGGEEKVESRKHERGTKGAKTWQRWGDGFEVCTVFQGSVSGPPAGD